MSRLWKLLSRNPPDPRPAAPPAERLFVPHGHFYSPVVDPDEVRAQQERIWPAHPSALGIDFNDASHREILERVFPKYIAGYDYPETLEVTQELTRYFNLNPQFGWLDSRTLFVMLREKRPRRVVEVGSGFSSLLIADVNRRFLGGAAEVTCIEPYPQPFLKNGIEGISRLVEAKVQEVALEEFSRLQAGDILFIDSSHVAKIGSDVNFLYFEVLPRLAPGVLVHIHDIFLPHDYPKQWVLEEGRYWNEQYVLRALLMYSAAFRLVFGCYYAFDRFPDLVASALGQPSGGGYGGVSIWLEVQPHG